MNALAFAPIIAPSAPMVTANKAFTVVAPLAEFPLAVLISTQLAMNSSEYNTSAVRNEYTKNRPRYAKKMVRGRA